VGTRCQRLVPCLVHEVVDQANDDIHVGQDTGAELVLLGGRHGGSVVGVERHDCIDLRSERRQRLYQLLTRIGDELVLARTGGGERLQHFVETPGK